MVWFVQPRELADDNGNGIGRFRLTACSDEGGGGPYGDTTHDHASAEEASLCEQCDEYCSRFTGFPSRKTRAAQEAEHDRKEYERLKQKLGDNM